MSEQTLTRKNYWSLDVAKVLCALLILFYHAFTEHPCLPSLLEEALSLYAVAVALFMTISGFLTFDKAEKMNSTSERWQYVKKSALRILKIYALWSIIYIAYTIYTWQDNDITLVFVLKNIQGWIFQSTFYTIWFMPSLAFGLIVTFWVREKLPKWAGIVIAIVLYCIAALMSTYKGVGAYLPFMSDFTEFAKTWLGGERGWLLYGFPLTLLGSYMVKLKDKMRWLPTMVLSVVFVGLIVVEGLVIRKFFGNSGIDLAFMMVPSVFCILGFLLSVKLPDGKWYMFLRKMSLLIFVSQRLFLTVLPNVLPQSLVNVVFANNFVTVLVISVSTIAFSVAFILLSKKVKFLKNMM